MKLFDYIIVFKRPGYRWVDGISQLMLLLAVIVFTYSLCLTVNNLSKTSYLLLALILAMAGWWLYCLSVLKKGEIPYFRLALLMAAVGWFLQPSGIYISLVYGIAAILEKQVKFPQELAFDAEGVVWNTFPKKYFSWSEIQNVLLKDGILTLDLQNNQLIQKEIESPVSAKTEQEFNGFCNNQLNHSNKGFS